MYITDARHFLDDKGAIGPQRGAAKAMAEFHASAIAYASDFDDAGLVAPTCFKCKKMPVQPVIAQDGDDTLGRLANTTFDRMLRDPLNYCLPDFAGSACAWQT